MISLSAEDSLSWSKTCAHIITGEEFTADHIWKCATSKKAKTIFSPSLKVVHPNIHNSSGT
jgi:hypothetical protein